MASAMVYSRRDFLSDVVFVGVLGILCFGGYRVLQPYLARIGAARGQNADRARTPVPAGTAIDSDWSVDDMDGREVPLSGFKGKVLFLNFWATWCGPCRLEMPSIEKLYAQYQATDVVILCVSEESPRELKTFIRKRDMRVPVYSARRIPPSFHVTGLPTTFIVSRSGQVALSLAGAARWDKPNVRRLLDSLLAQRQPTRTAANPNGGHRERRR